MRRDRNLQSLRENGDFDVAILGGGVNGACVFDALCKAGYRALLVDRGDFASGTSQASGMMVWGGLLYLKDGDLRTVVELSRDRDVMIRDMPGRMAARRFRYLYGAGRGRSKWLVRAALWLYWVLGLCRRRAPGSERAFGEAALIRAGEVGGSLVYEEGFLEGSDARFAF